MSEEKRDLFISYQWNIKEEVKKLNDFLQSKHYTVYRDVDTFVANSFLGSQISKAIKNSDVFICCLTEAYNNSENCLNEISLAKDTYKKPIIVLMFENADLKKLDKVNFYISSLLRINLFEEPRVMQTWSGPNADELIYAINKALGFKAQKSIDKYHENVLPIPCSSTRLKVVDLDKQECVRKLENNIKISTIKMLNKKQIATICEDKTVKLWDIFTGDCVFDVQAHDLDVNDVELIDENRLASASADNTIKFWTIDSGDHEFTLNNSSSSGSLFNEVVSLANISKNSLASGDCRGVIKIWDLYCKNCAFNLSMHKKTVTQLLIMKDDRLVSSSKDDTIRIWDLKTQRCMLLIDVDRLQSRTIIALNEDTIAWASEEGNLIIWDVKRNEKECVLEDSADCVTYLHLIRPNKLASVKLNKCFIWDLQSRKFEAKIPAFFK